MKSMKFSVVFAFLFAFVVSAPAQVTSSRALQPLYKQGVLKTPAQRNPPASAPAPAPEPAGAQPAAQRSSIEPDLHPSKINLFGKIDGLSGTFFVTNSGKHAVAPFVQLAAVDKNGRAVGWVTNSAPLIQPNETARIQVLATNPFAVDLKIVRLVGRK